MAPYSKTGGLGDVAGALPKALARRGHEVCVVTPLYRQVPRAGFRPVGSAVALSFPFGTVNARYLAEATTDGVKMVFVDAPAFFDRASLYEENGVAYPDNARRFCFFTMAALAFAQGVDFRPQVVHLNDWHTGLGALALKRGHAPSVLGGAKVLMTVHNLAYQGNFAPAVRFDLGLPDDAFTPEGLEFYGELSFLKAGLVYSDVITTVSPRYAREIQTEAWGERLDGLLRHRAQALHGVLNGIDTEVWNPETDSYLPARFRHDDLKGKAFCQRELRKRLGLAAPEKGRSIPLFAFVGRLVEAKGIELLLKVLPELLEQGVQVAVLGKGEAKYEQAFAELMTWHPKAFSARLDFDESLAHLMFAGSDFLLMPSRMEPCGLNQMYAMRYGTVPVVHAVGGLDDSVVEISPTRGTGFKFAEYTAKALMDAVEKAKALYADPGALAIVSARAMQVDNSWGAAAEQYEQLYEGKRHR